MTEKLDQDVEEQQATVKGLERAVNLLLPKLQMYRAGLEANGPSEFGGAIRQMFRSYAMVVGTLRWELDEIAGRSTDARFRAEDAFESRLEDVDTLREQLGTVKDPVKRDTLIEELEVAEQFADAAMVEFAAE
jgi:hypothetical protein